ncbi:MAG: T9SS type A sorting domain-containing protein [Bacteroidetes bacterium]|nr:T9SS type A sorting domain-containing protein [Bacteroidota bacterium]
MRTKLLSYSGAATAFLFAGSDQLKAQVVYGDIDPDVYITGDPADYFLDVNMDGEYEVYFAHTEDMFLAGFGCYGAVVPNYSYCFMNYAVDYGASWTFALKFDAGDPILEAFNNPPEALNLQHVGGGSTYGLGPWISEDDAYLGINFFTPSGDQYFAWVRLQVDECGYFIKDYAYAPEGIFAGEGLPVDVCEVPPSTDVTGIEAEKAKITWSDVTGATGYNVRFREVGATDWHEKTVEAPKTFIKLKTLNCDTEYEWQVQADCAGGLSEYTPLNTFTTLSCRLGETESVDFSIYPNPANGSLNVNFEEPVNNGIVEIFNFTGTLLYSETVNGYATTIDLSTLPAGMYFVSITADNVVQRQEFIKQ